MRFLLLLLICGSWLWAGCAPPPTPFPSALLPTPSPTVPLSIAPTAPFARTIVLLLDTRQPPLDDPAVLALLTAAIDPQVFALVLTAYNAQPLDRPAAPILPNAARTDLANLGFPDGLPLDMGGDVPGIEQFAALLRPYGLDLRWIADAGGAPHLTWQAERADQPPPHEDGRIRIPLLLLPAPPPTGTP